MLQEGQRFCLKWNNYHSSLTSLLDTLRARHELVDVTLCCQGRQLRAHRLVLSACSPYFREVLKTHTGDPVFFFKDAEFEDLVAIIEFIYNGQVNVEQARFTSFLAVAEMLKIKGLAKDAAIEQTQQVEATDLRAQSRPASPEPPPPPPPAPRSPARLSPVRSPALSPPPAKRRRGPVVVPELRRLLVPPPPPPLPLPPLPLPLPLPLPPPPPPPPVVKSEREQPSSEEDEDALCADSSPEPQPAAHQLPAAPEGGLGAYEPPPMPYQPLTGEVSREPPPPPPAYQSQTDAGREDEMAVLPVLEENKRNGGDSGDGGNDESLTEMMDVQGTSGLVEKKFVCRVCSRTYANLMTFRQHFESHKLSIQCWVCRKLCSRVTNLNAHLRNKHGVVMKQSELRKILKYMEQMGVAAVAEAMAAGRLLPESAAGDPADVPPADGNGDPPEEQYPTDLSVTGAAGTPARAEERFSSSQPYTPANGLQLPRGTVSALVRTDS